MTQRTERIDELLRQEIGQALEREVTDPGIGFVTVTNVETSPDLRACARLGERHRHRGAAQGDAGGAATGHAVHPPRPQLQDPAAPHPRAGSPAGRLDRAGHAGPADHQRAGGGTRSGARPRRPRVASDAGSALPHEGDVPDLDPAPPPAPKPAHKPGRSGGDRPRREAGVEARSKAGPTSGRERRPARAPMSASEPRVDLSDHAAAVPDEVVDAAPCRRGAS